MRMKPKTARRLALLAGVGVVGAGAFVGLVVVRGMQNSRVEAELRTEGMAAHRAGRDFAALQTLGRYLRREPADADALKAYAESRVAVEEAGGRHLREAVGVYQRYVDLRRDDEAARLELVRLYNRTGLFLEARQAARELRPEDLAQATEAHADALYEEATALLGLSRADDAFDALVDRLADVGAETRAALLRLEAIARSGGDPAGFASSLLEEDPEDPRWIVIDALARAGRDDAAARAELARRTAAVLGIDPETGERVGEAALSDPLLLREAVGVFDRLARFDLSIAALDVAARETGDVEVERLLARRLAQAARFEALTDRFGWREGELAEADTVLVAFRAMAELGLDRPQMASAYVEALASRAERDFRARGWEAALRLATPTGAETLSKRVATLREAVETHPGEPMIARMLADSLYELGREDEAIEVWEQVIRSPRSVGWMAPRVQLAEALLETGQALEALRAAEAARRVAPTSALANTIRFETLAEVARSGVDLSAEADRELRRIEAARRALDGEPGPADALRDRLLTAHVRLLCALGRTEQAAGVIEEAIGGASSPSELTMHGLAALSRRHALGLEDAIVSSARESFGPTPGVVYARALETARAGDDEAALAMIDEASEGDEQRRRAWRLARTKLLEAIGRADEAVAAWRALFESHPDDLEIVRLVLESDAAPNDIALVEAAAASYRELTEAREGDLSVLGATARARALLRGRPTKRQRDEAITLLERVATERQGAAQIRRMLADAHRMSDPSRGIEPDLAAAAAELEAASRLAPGDATLAFELAEVLRQRREYVRARDLLVRLADDESLDGRLRVRAVRMLIDQGEDRAALDALRDLGTDADAPSDPAVILDLARAYERLGDRARAVLQYERLAEMDVRDPAILAPAGAALERVDRMRLASRVREQLGRLGLEPARTSFYLGVMAERAGRDDDAADRYRAAAEANPKDREAQLALISLLLRTGRTEEAERRAREALEVSPEDPRLAVLVEQARFAAGGDPDADMAALIEAMRRDPDSASLAAALEEIQAARDAGRLDDPGLARDMLQRYPGTLAVQLFAAGRLAGAGNEHVPEAARVAERAMHAFPDAPEPARLAAELNMALGRWQAMLAAAKAWRQRDPHRPLEADLAIAQAQTRLGRHGAAADTVRAHVARASKSLDGPVDHGIVNVYATALAGSGRVDQALGVLEPLLPRSSTVRALVALPLGASMIGDLEAAEAWIDQVREHVPADDVDERIALAGALSTLAGRADGPDRSRLLNEALDTLHDLIAQDLATPHVLESIGKMHHSLGDLGAAESAYRQALSGDPEMIDSLNNLAVILLDEGEDLDESVDLAERAVALAPAGSLHEMDTLADALEALAKRLGEQGRDEEASEKLADAARAYGRMAAIAPQRPEPLWGLARASERAGRVEEAIAAYERLLELPSLGSDVLAAAENNLAVLLIEADRGEGDLGRAVVLAERASSGSEEASYHETLGRAQLALGRREAAIGAFREALALRPDMVAAMVGLAEALSDGGPDDRAEADELVARAKRLIEDGADAGPEILRALERLDRRFSAVDDPR